ncbi:MAG: adenosylcobinamide-GDP ribazoletransferase [Alistipes sp.]|nr:adenosylcobinamide-GDP ribazoletransferase [Alistipes sp.]
MTNRLLAALILFTRLPFWRLREVPADSFRTAVVCWPLVGWLTGGLSAAVLYGAGHLFPIQAAVVAALACRTLLTGALHEDGLGDFFDGFGGGRTREQTLAIMKDSHTGSYAILGLILYYLLLTYLLSSLGRTAAALALLAGDTFSKAVAAQLINLLPYARRREESKTKVIYDRMPLPALLGAAASGMLPLFLIFRHMPQLWWAGLAPVTVLLLLATLMKRRIGGYTGDCCGATFLLCELSFYAALAAIWGLH